MIRNGDEAPEHLLEKAALFEALAACFHPEQAPGAAPYLAFGREVPRAWGPRLRKIATADAGQDRVDALERTGISVNGRVSYRFATEEHCVLTELETLARLYAREAVARSAGRSDAAKAMRSARGHYLAEHVHPWWGAFARALKESAPDTRWALAADAALEAVLEELPPSLQKR